MASVKFNEKLKDAINVNILGTDRVLDLVKQIHHLKAFVHVSTFYSQCHLPVVEEKIYDSTINWQQLLALTENLSTEEVEDRKGEFMDSMPNTYTLTKRYAEELVSSEVGEKMPAGIFRPPILMSIYKEPFPGWTDNLNGPMGFSAAVVKGFVHILKSDGSKKSNIIPVDYSVNALLATAWDISCRVRTDDIPVYNYVYNENNLTWQDFHDVLEKRECKQPLENPMWHCFSVQCKTEFFYSTLFFLFHTIPGFVLDYWRMLGGKKRR
jgi:alcohol-forming fatty acyl-CoA reductase